MKKCKLTAGCTFGSNYIQFYSGLIFLLVFVGSPHNSFLIVHVQKFAKHQLLYITPVQLLVTFHMNLKHIINREFVHIPTYTFQVKDLGDGGINNGQSTLSFSNNLNIIYKRMIVKKRIGFLSWIPLHSRHSSI